jgi:high-affinity nickel permease
MKLTVGFDTASSIALLAISALAQKGPNGKSINHARIIILPVSLFFSYLYKELRP